MTITHNVLLVLAAIICFIIGLVIAASGHASQFTDWTPWLFGGLIAFAAAHLP